MLNNNLFVFSLNSALTSASGGDKYATELAKQFKEKGEVLVTTTKFRLEQYQKTDQNLNIMVFTDQPPTIHPFLYYIINLFKAYFVTLNHLKNYRKQNPKAKITYFSGCEYFPDIIPAFIFKMIGLVDVWVVTSHLIMPNMFQRYEDIYEGKKHFPSLRMAFNWLSQWLATTLYKIAKGEKYYFAVNKDIQNFLKIRGISANLVNCGVDSLKLSEDINTEKIYDGVFLARLHAQKGVQYIIPITKEVLKLMPNFKFLIIGGGNPKMELQLRREVQEQNLSENIIIVGQKIGKEKDDLLKQSKVFIFPSTYESFGIVILEAAAFGLPTVAFRLPFYYQIFGDSVKTVDFQDIVTFAKEVVYLLKNDTERADMSNKLKNLSAKYSWENTYTQILTYLQLY